MMEASQYRDYMDGLDTAAQRWQTQVSSVDIGKMNLDYAEGKLIENLRGLVLTDLRSIRSYIEAQRKGEANSLDFQRRLEAEIVATLNPQQKTDPKIRQALKPEVYEAPLTTDLEMEWNMGDALLNLTELADSLPSKNESLLFTGSINSITLELLQQQMKLRSHISAYADKLQWKANATCSK
jgi:hypothetical protein